jgi:hypothetical protein
MSGNRQVMGVLKRSVTQGLQACNRGVPIRAEELASRNGE